MKLVLHNLVLRPHEKERALLKICEKKLHAPCKYFKILKKSLDARDKSDIKWVYSVECSDQKVQREPEVFEQIKKTMPRVFVVGAGPCGLFCALRLLDHGIRPVVLERGCPVEEREQSIERFRRGGTARSREQRAVRRGRRRNVF